MASRTVHLAITSKLLEDIPLRDTGRLMFGAVMSITQAFGVCDVTMALCGYPSTDYAARTVVTHLFDYGFSRFEMGYASAIATVLFLVMILCNKAIQSMLRKVGS